MDLYTLSDTFIAKDTIDQFVSAIWTERYSVAGDVQLVVPATQENIDMLVDGTFLALRGSKEVMIIETQSIEDDLLTVVGGTLPTFLNQRVAWFKNPDSSDADSRVVDYVQTTVPGQFVADVVDKMVIHPVSLGGAWAPADLNWPLEVIPHLTIGAVDTTGVAERLTVPIGGLYDGISQLTTKYGVGMSLYLESADPHTGYSLKFTTYQGKDRTTGSAYPLVRLTPDMDSISGLKEIRSISSYKNVCYVYYKGVISEHLAEPTQPAPEGFARRIMITNPDSEPVGHQVPNIYYGYGGNYSGLAYQTIVSPADEAAFRAQVATDALANNNYIRAIDGQTSPQNDYTYGVDYTLGDLIELQGITGLITKARITEYIRSQDQDGSKEYPTISVVS